MPASSAAPPSEAQTVLWLKRSLAKHGLDGRRASNFLVDSDPSYRASPYRRQLEPMGTVRIDGSRPDLVCMVEHQGSSYLVGFEVKGGRAQGPGIIQASRYRQAVHEAYLCVPENGATPNWLVDSARRNGVGLLRASADVLTVVVPPEPPRPEPALYLATRRYLIGESSARSLQLNKPLHYLAALVACAFTPEPMATLTARWGLQESAARHAVSGAETLGLVHDSMPTPRGRAYADLLRVLGFDFETARPLTRVRLADHAPGFAAVARAVLLAHEPIGLVVQALLLAPGTPLDADALARRAHALDEATARALFGPPPEAPGTWTIRPWARFQLKAALYDAGVLDSRLAPGAGAGQRGAYDPRADFWRLSGALMS